MDLKIANWFYEVFGTSKTILKIAEIITHFGDAISIIAIVALLLIFKKTRKLGLYAMFTTLITFCFNNYFLKLIISRERPFVQMPELFSVIELIGYKIPSGYSMASGHAMVSMCLAVCIFLFNKKAGSIAIVISTIIGFTRLVLCVHFLSDVLVGFALGTIFAITIHYLIKLITKKYKEKRRKNMKKIVLATGNKHKLKEIAEMMKGYDIVSLKDIGFVGDVEETGKTMEENARIKARAIAEFCKSKGLDYYVMADDSGLCVNALDGAPGVYSARFAEDHNDEANRQKLLSELENKDDRSAYYECDICFIEDGKEIVFVGKTHGEITKEKIGKEDFCYDCLFYSTDLKKTFGESTDEEKNAVSHRGRAVSEVKKYLDEKNPNKNAGFEM